MSVFSSGSMIIKQNFTFQLFVQIQACLQHNASLDCLLFYKVHLPK